MRYAQEWGGVGAGSTASPVCDEDLIPSRRLSWWWEWAHNEDAVPRLGEELYEVEAVTIG
jgi:hypothetical protein